MQLIFKRNSMLRNATTLVPHPPPTLEQALDGAGDRVHPTVGDAGDLFHALTLHADGLLWLVLLLLRDESIVAI
jgi:hypothetical protein